MWIGLEDTLRRAGWPANFAKWSIDNFKKSNRRVRRVGYFVDEKLSSPKTPDSYLDVTSNEHNKFQRIKIRKR